MVNCGLEALGRIKDMKGVSAFTLIHLAKDNGVNLKIFKVKEADLPLVHRPAIFHAENHFEYVQNGEALPDLKWSGYVLTGKSIGTPVSFREAKLIKGEKKGGFFKQIGAIIVGAVITIATGGLGAPAGAALIAGAAAGGVSQIGMDEYARNRHPEQLGEPGQIGSILGSGLRGALAGAGGGSAAQGFQAGSAAATKAGGNATIGGLKGSLVGTAPTSTTAGSRGIAGSGGKILGIGSQGLSPTGVSGLKLTGDTSMFGGVTPINAGSISSGSGALAGASQGAAGLPASSGLAKGGFGLSSGPVSFDPSGAVIQGAGKFNPRDPGVQSILKGTNNYSSITNPTGAGATGAGGGFNVGNSLKTLGAASAIQGVAGALGPKQPGELQFDPQKEFTVLRDFLGDQALPQATEKELMTYVHTPLTDLSNQLSPQRDKIISRLNKSFDLRDAQIRKQYAQFGQNETNSTEAAKQLQLSQQDRATAIQEAEQEFQSDAIGKAIQAKQFALTSSIQNNQFDQQLAFELADSIGQKEALNQAIQSQNYQQFQDIISQILNIGFGAANQGSGININLGGTA